MTDQAELTIVYDQEMKPISAMCTGCREHMPTPPAHMANSADIIVWLSERYLEHRKLKHATQDEKRRVPRD